MGHAARLVLLGLVVVGLLAAASAGTAQRSGGTLRVGLSHDIGSVDPAIAWNAETWTLELATCAKLYTYPPKGATPVPEVATALPSLSADGKTQTITLQRGYRFHTGAAVRAVNFVAAINRGANPKLQSGAAYYLREVVGAEAVIDGSAEAISGVRALGPYTLQVRTTRPLPDLASRLTMPFFCPIATNTPLSEIDLPLGSGPYYVASRVPNRQVVLQRNPHYRGPRAANVDRIVWTIKAPEACRQAVEQDELDWCDFTPPTDVPELTDKFGINRPNGRLFFNSTLTQFYFAFNHDRRAFKGVGQIPVKQAINWVLDRHALAGAVSYLGGRRTDQILGAPIARDATIYPIGGVTEQNVATARALFARAAFKPSKLVLYTNTAGFKGVNPVWAEIFKYDLKRLGIDVEIKYFATFGQLLARVGTRGEPFDVVIGAWSPDYPDGFAYFGPLLDGHNLAASGNDNFAYFDRPKYNSEIERIGRLTGDERTKAWEDLDVALMRDDPPWAPFLNGTELDFVSPSYGCYVFRQALAIVDLAAACKK